MEQELNIAYDQKLTREVWQRVAQSLPPLEAPAADTGSCGIAAPPPEDSTHRLRRFIDEELSMTAVRSAAPRLRPAGRCCACRMRSWPMPAHCWPPTIC